MVIVVFVVADYEAFSRPTILTLTWLNTMQRHQRRRRRRPSIQSKRIDALPCVALRGRLVLVVIILIIDAV